MKLIIKNLKEMFKQFKTTKQQMRELHRSELDMYRSIGKQEKIFRLMLGWLFTFR